MHLIRTFAALFVDGCLYPARNNNKSVLRKPSTNFYEYTNVDVSAMT